jgi:hypothetical protein
MVQKRERVVRARQDAPLSLEELWDITAAPLRGLSVARARALYREHREELIERMEEPHDRRGLSNPAADAVAIRDDDPEVRARAQELRAEYLARRGIWWQKQEARMR